MSLSSAHRTRPATYVDDSAHRARRNDFDLLAPVYDELASLAFGSAARRAQTELLPQLRDAQTALVIGGGTGWFLHALLAETGVQRVLYIEKSANMLARSRSLIASAASEWLARVDFRHGTEESLTAADGPFDLIVTNFFLGQFNDGSCAKLIERLAAQLSEAGRWLFVDLHTPESGWERVAAKVLYKLVYTFVAVTSQIEARRPPHYQATFDRLRLRTELEHSFNRTLIRARLLARS
jgi:ubiquinone/menaquinone biosynthesis C-methylase UbiE